MAYKPDALTDLSEIIRGGLAAYPIDGLKGPMMALFGDRYHIWDLAPTMLRDAYGLAWDLPLSELWESFVETIVRREAALAGAEVRCGRKSETLFPIRWTDSSLRGMSHLVPDFVVKHRDQVKIIDAKYKAHFSELDESGWLKMAEDSREAHRADFHQVLAYASLFDAKQTTVTLVYPFRYSTYEALSARKRDIVRADLSFAGRTIQAELRGVAFGGGVE